MNASDLIRLLKTDHYSPADLDEVNKLCSDYPEFTTAHLLKVRIMEALGYKKEKELKIAAVYSMNRKKLHQLVTGVRHMEEVDREPLDESPATIHFSEENNELADVIIEQHAPYAGVEPGTDLLELDEEPEGPDEGSTEDPTDDQRESALDEPSGESHGDEVLDLEEDPAEDSDSIISSLEKNDMDMEEPETLSAEVPTIDQVDEVEENNNNHLITTFLKGDPGPIRADKETSLKGDVSLASIREHDGFITDTLAQIYVKQGLYAKAIYAYEKLSLKYPEKSAYFAAQIEKIRNINHS